MLKSICTVNVHKKTCMQIWRFFSISKILEKHFTEMFYYRYNETSFEVNLQIYGDMESMFFFLPCSYVIVALDGVD